MRSLHHFLTRDLWVMDLERVPFWKRWVLRTVRLLLAAVWEFQHRLLNARAAGLVYTTLLSLVPLLAVVVAVLKLFGLHERPEFVLDQLVAPLGPNGREVSGWLTQFVGNFDVGVLGLFGVGGLLYTSYSLIEKMEETFNALWRVPRSRPWTQKIVLYFTVILVAPLVMTVALGLLTSLEQYEIVQRLLGFRPFGALAGWTAEYVSYLLLALVFSFFYKFLPNARVRTVSALIGGTAAALVWGAAGQAFAFFVARSTSYSAMYSSSAIIVLFLLWLYVGWMIILLGAQVAFFYQHPNSYEWQYLGSHGVQALRERTGMQVLRVLAQRELAGRSLGQVEDIVGEGTGSLPFAEELLEVFIEAGYLARTGRPKHLTFVKPISEISLDEVIRVIHQGGVASGALATRSPSDRGDPVVTVLQRRDLAVGEALRGLTVEWLAREGSTEVAPAPHEGLRDERTA